MCVVRFNATRPWAFFLPILTIFLASAKVGGAEKTWDVSFYENTEDILHTTLCFEVWG